MQHPTADATVKWREYRNSLRRRWWTYAGIAVAGAAWFVHNVETGEPNLFAVLMLIPLIALRQAWKVDRQIVACDRRMTGSPDGSTMPGH